MDTLDGRAADTSQLATTQPARIAHLELPWPLHRHTVHGGGAGRDGLEHHAPDEAFPVQVRVRQSADNMPQTKSNQPLHLLIPHSLTLE